MNATTLNEAGFTQAPRLDERTAAALRRCYPKAYCLMSDRIGSAALVLWARLADLPRWYHETPAGLLLGVAEKGVTL